LPRFGDLSIFLFRFSDLIGSITGTRSITSATSANLSLTKDTRTFSGVISGAVSLTVKDTAIQTLNSANTYTGATTIGGNGGANTPGVLILGVDNAMSQSPLDTLNSAAGTAD
jgi:autotransporter-associated beta strand protein